MQEISEKRKIFIAPLDWGLGHAARILPLIKRFLADDCDVFLAVTGRAKEFFQRELSNVNYIDFPRYPIHRYGSLLFCQAQYKSTVS